MQRSALTCTRLKTVLSRSPIAPRNAYDRSQTGDYSFEAMFGDLISWPKANLGAFSLLLLAVLWLRYITRRDSFDKYNKRGDAKGVPQTFPYVFPLLGSLPFTYLWKPRDFVLDPK